jgi:hypothetical protein
MSDTSLDFGARLIVLVEEILAIADRAVEKDQIPAAKLQIEARQWVVEKWLLKDTAKREKDAGSEPISVTINATSDAA